jgi:hypothetical protein
MPSEVDLQLARRAFVFAQAERGSAAGAEVKADRPRWQRAVPHA